MSHKSHIVKKPWGYEYLAYENEDVALWFLHIDHEQETSMHCHPNKTTGLMVLDGSVNVSFLRDANLLVPENKIMIRKGLFHSTKALSAPGANIFEIETPVDKQDLVRLRDSYGREGKPYEDQTHEIPKQEDCVWFEEPPSGHTKRYKLSNCIIDVVRVKNISYFSTLEEKTNVMFLRGGILTDYGIYVAGAGDIISSDVLEQLTKVFDKTAIETVVMVVKNENFC